MSHRPTTLPFVKIDSSLALGCDWSVFRGGISCFQMNACGFIKTGRLAAMRRIKREKIGSRGPAVLPTDSAFTLRGHFVKKTAYLPEGKQAVQRSFKRSLIQQRFPCGRKDRPLCQPRTTWRETFGMLCTDHKTNDKSQAWIGILTSQKESAGIQCDLPITDQYDHDTINPSRHLPFGR
jgi:hypothetical protein